MRKAKYLIYYFTAIIFIVNSCRSSQTLTQTSAGEPNAAAYISKYKDLAISEMKRTGVPASITLAQGMIESDFGRSRLAREGNNHFGIKCHNDWKGPTIRHHDDKRNECFRKYSHAEESFYDHSDFLRSGSRYSFLFSLAPDDYKGWARGLKRAGYATNPQYADMLIRKIEENSLFYFDSGKIPVPAERVLASAPATDKGSGRVSGNGAVEFEVRIDRVRETNRIQYIIVRDGETREKIENEFNLLKWELARYNELDPGFTPYAGQILYLQPKRDKAEPGMETHTVTEGETMYSVSQKYGIRMKRLYELNRIPEGTEPASGDKLWLRTPKPVR